MKEPLKQKVLQGDLHFFMNVLDINLFLYFDREEIKGFIKQFKERLDTRVKEETEIELLQMIYMLYKELDDDPHADKYYINLLNHPYIDKSIWEMVRESFPHFSNYRICEAWRLVKPS